MSKTEIIRIIMSLVSIDELARYVGSRPEDDLRAELLQQFERHIEYEDADQWATAVRICECLAIVGWGSRERVDAISHFNRDCWETRFVTKNNEYRFRLGRWRRKRKNGWVLFNTEYCYSPDLPAI